MARTGQYVCAPLATLLLCASYGAGQSASDTTLGSKAEDEKALSEAETVGRAKGGFTGEMPFRIHRLSESEEQEIDGQVVQVHLKPVEQAVGDLGPLVVSLRDVSQGLEMPMGFFKVYETPGYMESAKKPGEQPERRFMRADGALAALYDRSSYIPTKKGLIPDIPESTIWVIGGVPLTTLPGHGMLLPVDPLNPSALPQRNVSFPTATTGRASRDQVGFGVAPDSMWRAQPEDKVNSEEIEEVHAPPCRFLEDPEYRKTQLETLLKHMRRGVSRQIPLDDRSS